MSEEDIDGLVESGNIDLFNRPIVKNPDGSISTVKSMSFDTDRGVVLVPTIADDGTVMNPKDAISYAMKNRKHLGIFKDRASADKYAESLHNQQAEFYKEKPKANTLPYEERVPYEGEDKFFKSRPEVAGMAAEDDKIVMNPYSNLNKQQQDAVRRNEAYRIYMRQNKIAPEFDVSEDQAKFFENTEYAGNPEAMRQTIAARILTGDRSVTPTDKQIQWAKALQKKAGF
jgi:hypothetical protein